MHASLKLGMLNKSGYSSLRLVSRLAHSESSVTLSSDDHHRYARMAEIDPDAEYSPSHSPAAKAVARANRIRLSLKREAGVDLGDVEIAELMNGMTVASVPTEFPAYSVQLAVKCGPRFEDANSLGVSHVIRRMFGLASKPFRFAVNQNRTLQQIGANVECKASRESIAYELSQYKFADEAIDIAATAFAFASTMPAFYPWEISRNMPMLRKDLADIRGSTELLIDQLHSVAYKGGLGNSLWCPEYRMGEINADVVEDFYNKHFTPDRFALVGVGLPLGTLKDLAHKFSFLEPRKPAQPASRWLGGESRVSNGNPCVRIAVAMEGAAVTKENAALAQTVACAALTGCASSPLSSAVAGAAGNGPAAVSGLNMQYSDSGLFGFNVVCDYRDAAGVVRACLDKIKELAGSGIPSSAFASGKAALSVQSSEAQLDPSSRLNELSSHLLVGSPLNLAESVEKVTIEQANAQLKSLVANGGKRLAVASIGRLDNVPYRDELQL